MPRRPRAIKRERTNVTIIDVAREAGVSSQTVSRVVNNEDYVSESTRQRVLDAIQKLGYAPHIPAQRLRSGSVRTIAILYPLHQRGNVSVNQLQLEFALGAAAAAGNENYFCNLITNTLSGDELLGLFRGAQVDGIVLMEIHLDDWRVKLLNDEGYPFVMIGKGDDNTGVSYIELDMEAAIVQAFDHLVALGHREIAFLTFPEWLREEGLGPAVRVWAGYQESLKNHGLKEAYSAVEFMPQAMFDATLGLLDEHPALTALVSATDATTAGVINALNQRERRVPADFSVVGLSPDRVADIIIPPLTAVRFPSYEMGFQAASLLIAKLERRVTEPTETIIVPELIVRASSGPVRMP